MKNLSRLFHGRINRSTFFIGWLAFLLFALIFALIVLPLTDGLQNINFFNGAIMVLGAVIIYGYFASLAVRRFHDFKQSGWLALLFLIPYVGFFLLLFYFLRVEMHKTIITAQYRKALLT